MDVSDFNKSNSPYLRADDIGGPGAKPVKVKIKEVTQEEMQDGELKYVAWFKKKSKGLVLNKTNSRALTDLAMSADTDTWSKLKLEIYVIETSMGPGLRIRGRDGHRQAEAELAKQNAANTQQQQDEDFDDDIPF